MATRMKRDRARTSKPRPLTEIERLAAEQGVKPIRDIDDLAGGWPEDESVDDFVAAYRSWRDEESVGRPE